MKKIETFNNTITTRKLTQAKFDRKAINTLLSQKYIYKVERGLYAVNTNKLDSNKTHFILINNDEYSITTKEFLPANLLVQVSEKNMDLLLNTNTTKELFEELILLYRNLGEQYEQIIHQTTLNKEALQIKKYLENILSISNLYLEKIKIQFHKEDVFLESLVNEIENIEELTQDIQLKFFDIPLKTSIHEILNRI